MFWVESWFDSERMQCKTTLLPLTQKTVDRARPRKVKHEIYCGRIKGFLLRVLPSGKKAYYVRYRSDEKDIRERIGSTTEIAFADAKAYAQARLTEVGAPAESRRVSRSRRLQTPRRVSDLPTLEDFAERFIREHVDVRLKPCSKRKYRQMLRTAILPRFGKHRLDEISRADVIRWHGKMCDTPYEANASLRLLSSIFGRAREWEVLPETLTPPTSGVKKYPGKTRERFLSPEERVALEQALDRGLELPRNRVGTLRWESAAAIRLLSFTGMRRSEVCNLTWMMVDWRHRCLRLPDSKTGKKVVPLSDAAIELLRECRRRAKERRCASEYVVPSKNGTAILPSTLTRTWTNIRNRIPGFERVRLHDLRHSAASDAINAGVPLAVVGKILGHKKPSTTARYAHISDKALKEGVQVMGEAITRNSRGKGK